MMTTPLAVEKPDTPARSANFAGETLTYASAETSLGLVLAVSSIRGLCSVALGQDRESMMAELRARFPMAVVDGEPLDKSSAAADAIAQMIESPGAEFALPLDTRGTPFQRAVWDALCQVPAGQTTTYAGIADRIGSPKAVRAVGAACGANRLAVIIPCHRAVASDGKLTGYRWGIEWKRALLERESRQRQLAP